MYLHFNNMCNFYGTFQFPSNFFIFKLGESYTTCSVGYANTDSTF